MRPLQHTFSLILSRKRFLARECCGHFVPATKSSIHSFPSDDSRFKIWVSNNTSHSVLIKKDAIRRVCLSTFGFKPLSFPKESTCVSTALRLEWRHGLQVRKILQEECKVRSDRTTNCTISAKPFLSSHFNLVLTLCSLGALFLCHCRKAKLPW